MYCCLLGSWILNDNHQVLFVWNEDHNKIVKVMLGPRRGRGGGVRCTLDFNWQGWLKDCFGLNFLIPRLFWVGKFSKYFFWWPHLHSAGINFLGSQNNLKIKGGACVSRLLSSVNKVQSCLEIFKAQSFGMGCFWSKEFFRCWYLLPFNHPRLLKSWVLPQGC